MGGPPGRGGRSTVMQRMQHAPPVSLAVRRTNVRVVHSTPQQPLSVVKGRAA